MADNEAPDRYCIDTSSLIAAWIERYPPEHFGSFWTSVDDLITEGRLISSTEVEEEIVRQDDGLKAWCDDHPELFLAIDHDQQVGVTKILKKYPQLTKAFPTRNRADPWVIALAQLKDATVITEEGPGTTKKPKIPFVCEDLGIPCVGLVEMIRVEGWDF